MKSKFTAAFFVVMTVFCVLLSACIPTSSSQSSQSSSSSSDDPIVDVVISLDYAYNEDDTYTVTGIGNVPDTDLVIPETHNEKPVTAIAAGAFKDCVQLQSVTVGSHITQIGSGAFSGCSGLVSVSLPFVGDKIGDSQYPLGYIFGEEEYEGGKSVQQFYRTQNGQLVNSTYFVPQSLQNLTITGGNLLYGAFYNCGQLKNITLPDGITEIGERCFYGCGSLESVLIPDSVLTIQSLAFAYCKSLTDIVVPEGVLTVGASAFHGCSGLKTAAVAASVTQIGSGAFSGCSGLQSITLPFVGAMVKSGEDNWQYPFGYVFGTDSYSGATGVRQYYFGASLTETTSSTYYLPSSLETVVISGGYIVYGSFFNCSFIKEVTIGSSVTGIGAQAFNNCKALSDVVLQEVNGWQYSETYNSDSKTALSRAYLSNSQTAANYLKSDYKDYYWSRT